MAQLITSLSAYTMYAVKWKMKFPSEQQRGCMKFQSIIFKSHLLCFLCFLLVCFIVVVAVVLFQGAKWTAHRCKCIFLFLYTFFPLPHIHLFFWGKDKTTAFKREEIISYGTNRVCVQVSESLTCSTWCFFITPLTFSNSNVLAWHQCYWVLI